MTLAILALVCFGLAIALLLRLHLARTRLDPVVDAVSDYGTTRYHHLYRGMVVALGAGAILLAVGLGRYTNAGSLAWLWVYGAARTAIAGFMTDRDPPPFTREGRIHWLLAAVAFTAIAFAASDITWAGASGVARPLGYAVAATAIATLLTRVIVPLRRVFGLAERLLYATSLAWLIVGAIDLVSAT
jgi:hypothetical protein